jgi:hypothetical protein
MMCSLIWIFWHPQVRTGTVQTKRKGEQENRPALETAALKVQVPSSSVEVDLL